MPIDPNEFDQYSLWDIVLDALDRDNFSYDDYPRSGEIFIDDRNYNNIVDTLDYSLGDHIGNYPEVFWKHSKGSVRLSLESPGLGRDNVPFIKVID